jgi:hypothetical protein
LSLVKVPFGPVKFVVARRDIKGNTRTWAVNYRSGDLGRLAALRHPIRRLFGDITDTGAAVTETGESTVAR